MATSNAAAHLSFQEALFREYGPVMDAKAICKVLYYPTVGALQAAKARGQLPFDPLPLKGRRGIFAVTAEIAQALDQAAQARTQMNAPLAEGKARGPVELNASPPPVDGDGTLTGAHP